MNGKSKSRFKSKTKETRTRLVLKERKRVIALRTEGYSKEQVEDKLGGVPIGGRTWRRIWNEREKTMKMDDCPLRDFNHKHVTTDSKIRKEFEARALTMIQQKAGFSINHFWRTLSRYPKKH